MDFISTLGDFAFTDRKHYTFCCCRFQSIKLKKLYDLINKNVDNYAFAGQTEMLIKICLR